MPSSSSLTFFGALHHVTGSMHFGQHSGTRWVVDCGLIQGSREAERGNYAAWPVDPVRLTTAVLTHAHMDHSGRLPKLVGDGFGGAVHSTRGTKDLAEVLLADGAKLQGEEAKYRYKTAKRRGLDPDQDPFTWPLYEMPQVRQTLAQMTTHQLGEWFSLGKDVECRFHDAGHILGSAHAELRLTLPKQRSATILYSGDIGRYGVALMRDPDPPPSPDLLVMEATYGDRVHAPESDVDEQMAAAISRTINRGGVVLMPTFAVARTQTVLWFLARLEREGRIPQVPIYLDSPMARRATALYSKYPDLLDPPRHGQSTAMELPRQFSEVDNRRASKMLNDRHRPCIIIAASGMLGGGRVLHHLKMRAPVSENLILFTGYQADGTLGRRLIEGASEFHLFGEDIPLRAEVDAIRGLSAHADRNELLRWCRSFKEPPKRAFVVHGEPEAMTSLMELVRTELGWVIEVPPFNQALPLADLLG